MFVCSSTRAVIKYKQILQPFQPAHIKTLSLQRYIFITYLSLKWLHHLTFKSRLLHWRHSAEFIKRYDTAKTPLKKTSAGITDNGPLGQWGVRRESESQERQQEGFSLQQIMTTQAISPCQCVATTVTIGWGSLYQSWPCWPLGCHGNVLSLKVGSCSLVSADSVLKVTPFTWGRYYFWIM